MQPYTLALASVMVAIAAGLAIQQVAPTNAIAFLLFVPPILVTALWMDTRASIAATLGGGVAAEYFFRTPYFTFPKGADEFVPLTLYLVIGAGTAVLGHRLARARQVAQLREAENAELYRQAQEANRLKDDFLASLSHELRTPLNALLGWIQLLRSGQLAEAKRVRALDAIERSAELQARLIGDLLDVSSAMTGKLRLTREAVDVAPLIEGVVDSMRAAAGDKGIELHTTISRIGMMELDPSRLQQIVANLLSNAIKFTPPGGRIDTVVNEVAGDLCVVVADTGIGIDRDFLPFVFDRFRQADARTTREHAGLGLGLAIVRHLAELHGGTVEAASVPGEGATFTVRIPARGASPASAL
jgi:signal transduction histidine kinase